MYNLTTRSLALAIIICQTSYVNASKTYHLGYTIESTTYLGNECMTDCDTSGKCWTAFRNQESCHPGSKKVARYFTAQVNNDSSILKCRSKCVHGGYDYSWCYTDDYSSWDYCSPALTYTGKWYQYTTNNGRCKDKCEKRGGTSYLWCNTYWTGYDKWDYCKEDWYYEEAATTINGKECYSNCTAYVDPYYYCLDENKSYVKCAPTALFPVCPQPQQRQRRSIRGINRRTLKRTRRSIRDINNRNPTRIRRSVPPRKTVAEYNQDVDRDTTLITMELSTRNNLNNDNPILDYTYRVAENNIRLPVRVRALIRPCHINTNARTSDSISAEARRNCDSMGMNRGLANGNDDQYGHLVAFILSGPSDWYNIVPQTRRINVGTRESSDLNAPSLWGYMERNMRHWVSSGGTVEFTVLVTYDLNSWTRPSGFGLIERYLDTDGTPGYECPGYWLSNDPLGDPDDWNNYHFHH